MSRSSGWSRSIQSRTISRIPLVAAQRVDLLVERAVKRVHRRRDCGAVVDPRLASVVVRHLDARDATLLADLPDGHQSFLLRHRFFLSVVRGGPSTALSFSDRMMPYPADDSNGPFHYFFDSFFAGIPAGKNHSRLGSV